MDVRFTIGKVRQYKTVDQVENCLRKALKHDPDLLLGGVPATGLATNLPNTGLGIRRSLHHEKHSLLQGRIP